MTEQEIADKLGVDRTTISRDIEVLKQTSQQFVYGLAHSGLAYYYKQCLNGLEEAKRKAWTIFGTKSVRTRTNARSRTDNPLR